RDPNAGLCALRVQGLVLQRASQCVLPMAGHLHVMIAARRPQLGCDAAEFELKDLRLPHRRSSLELLPTCVGVSDKLVQSCLGDAQSVGAMQQWKELRHGLVERPRQARLATLEIEKVCVRHHLVPYGDVVTSGSLETDGVPGVFDLPVACRHDENTDHWRAT